MKNILIGCPTYRRDWVLPTWIKAIENQDYPMENLGFVFELGPDDDNTHRILWEWQLTHPEFKIFDAQVYMSMTHEEHPDGYRIWSSDKFLNMVTLRNNLLDRATVLSDQFDYYFSLDSDILLENPQTLNRLIEYAEDKSLSVISPLMYMTESETTFPSAMSWENEPGSRAVRMLERYKKDELFEVDIVMAAVFMQKEVFTKVRYKWHQQGEDLGFAKALSDQGFRSYAAWDIYCPHIMQRAMLHEYLTTGIDARNVNKIYI